jgi:phosphatidylinositol-3-phosphatase
MVPPPVSTKAIRVLVSLSVFAAAAAAQNVPRSRHVWIINEENHGFEDVVGSAQMPYYNQLIQQNGLATQFYSDQHSSLPALMWFVAGAAVETDNDTTSCQHSEDNVVRELLKRGYTWRSYQEDLPSAGYQGLYGGTDGDYYRRHNPLIDFTDVCPGTGQDLNVVPFTQMATDLADGCDVSYAWITPDVNDDAHNGTLNQADQWLQEHVPAILARPEFASGGDGILFIVWDESDLSTDNRCSASVATGCGGRTATLVMGPLVKRGYQSTVTYHNENVLSTVCAAMGLSPCPGAAQTAAPMADFFQTGGSSTASNSVIISNPGNGATIVGAVHLIAGASENQSVSQMQVWDNGAKLGAYPGDAVDEIYNLKPGKHTTTVTDHDSANKLLHQSSVTYDVEPVVNGLVIVSPVLNQAFNLTTVHVVAQAEESVPVSQIQVWDNGAKLGRFLGNSVNAYFNLSPGSHTLSVLDLNDQYEVIRQTSVSYSVQ